MTKYLLEQKLDAVTRYKQGNESVKEIAKQLEANHEFVRMWIKQFEYHGIKGFEKSYTVYSMRYKLDVLNYMNENVTSPNETAVIFNISSSGLIRKWQTQLSTHGIDALESKKKGRPSIKKENQKVRKNQAPAEESIEALQAEVERLRMENAYLKKLNALVQNKEKSPSKTKRR